MSVTSVNRAFHLLRAVEAGAETVSALSVETGLPLATTARLLNTLEQIGALIRMDKRYRIGPTIADLAGEPAPYDLIGLSTAHMSDLVALTNETSGLAESIGHETLQLFQITAERDVTVKDWTGTRVPVHHGCIGFVVMAHWSEHQIDSYLDGDLVELTPNTVTDPAVIRTRLGLIRDRGWLWTVDEYASGVATVAAPIRDSTGSATGSIHVYGPSYRFPMEGTEDAIGREVSQRADAIGSILGWSESVSKVMETKEEVTDD